MSSSQYDQSLPIPEMINIIKHSFRECEFDEVEKVLTGREINMRIAMKDLELENMELVDKLEKSRRKCQELETQNSEQERFMGRVYQEKFRCLEENEKLKGELTELKEQNEKLTARYNDLARDHKKLDGKLVKALIEAIDLARTEGYTQAQQVYETFPKTEKNADKNVDELGGERLKQSGSKGLKGSGPHAVKDQLMVGSGYSRKTTPSPGICDSNDEPVSCGAPNTSNTRANVGEKEMVFGKNKRKRREDSPVRSTTKRKSRSDDSLPICKKENEVIESDSQDESDEPETNITRTTRLPHYLTYESQITSNCVNEIRKFAGISPEYKIIIPSLQDKPNRPPPGFICLYTHQVYGGLRFPIPPLFSDISRLFNVSLSQLAPNAFRVISSFAMAVLYLGGKPTARLFHSYFHPKHTEDGFFYFSSRADVRFLKCHPRSKSAWKKQYCFISSPQAWNFPTVWRDSLPEEKTSVIQHRSPAFKSLLDRLNKNPYNISQLVDPALLYHFGLSPLFVRLSKSLDETMANNLMKEDALDSSKRRQGNSSSAKIVKEVVE